MELYQTCMCERDFTYAYAYVHMCTSMCVGESGEITIQRRETKRQRDKETERQRDKETKRQRDKETERQTETERDRDRPRYVFERQRQRHNHSFGAMDQHTTNSGMAPSFLLLSLSAPAFNRR